MLSHQNGTEGLLLHIPVETEKRIPSRAGSSLDWQKALRSESASEQILHTIGAWSSSSGVSCESGESDDQVTYPVLDLKTEFSGGVEQSSSVSDIAPKIRSTTIQVRQINHDRELSFEGENGATHAPPALSTTDQAVPAHGVHHSTAKVSVAWPVETTGKLIQQKSEPRTELVTPPRRSTGILELPTPPLTRSSLFKDTPAASTPVTPWSIEEIEDRLPHLRIESPCPAKGDIRGSAVYPYPKAESPRPKLDTESLVPAKIYTKPSFTNSGRKIKIPKSRLRAGSPSSTKTYTITRPFYAGRDFEYTQSQFTIPPSCSFSGSSSEEKRPKARGRVSCPLPSRREFLDELGRTQAFGSESAPSRPSSSISPDREVVTSVEPPSDPFEDDLEKGFVLDITEESNTAHEIVTGNTKGGIGLLALYDAVTGANNQILFEEEASICFAITGKRFRCKKKLGSDKNKIRDALEDLKSSTSTPKSKEARKLIRAAVELTMCAGSHRIRLQHIELKCQKLYDYPSGVLQYSPIDLFLGMQRYETDVSSQTAVGNALLELIASPLSKEDRTSSGFIYAYAVGGLSGLHKIGMARGETPEGVRRRFKQWESQCKHRILPQFVSEKACRHVMRVEKLIHTELKEFRRKQTTCVCWTIHREWFDIKTAHATDVIKKWTTWMDTSPYGEDGQLKLEHEAAILKLCEPILCEPPRPPEHWKSRYANRARGSR